MDLGVTDKVKPLIDKVRQMVSDDIEPLDQEFHEEVGRHPSGSRRPPMRRGEAYVGPCFHVPRSALLHPRGP